MKDNNDDATRNIDNSDDHISNSIDEEEHQLQQQFAACYLALALVDLNDQRESTSKSNSNNESDSIEQQSLITMTSSTTNTNDLLERREIRSRGAPRLRTTERANMRREWNRRYSSNHRQLPTVITLNQLPFRYATVDNMPPWKPLDCNTLGGNERRRLLPRTIQKQLNMNQSIVTSYVNRSKPVIVDKC